MPTYDYACGACGHTWERVQSIKDGPARRCPACGRLKARRLVGRGACVRFLGPGWQTNARADAERRFAIRAKSPRAQARER